VRSGSGKAEHGPLVVPAKRQTGIRRSFSAAPFHGRRDARSATATVGIRTPRAAIPRNTCQHSVRWRRTLGRDPAPLPVQAETVPRPRRCADQCQPDVGSSRRHPPDIGQVGWLHPPTARLRRRQVRWNSGNRPAPRAVRPAGVAYFSRRRRSRTSIREVLTLVQKSSRGGKSSLSDAGVSGGAVPLVAI